MAQAPTAEQTVFPEQGPLPEANGADFGAQIGAADQGFGQQLQNTGDVIAKHVLQWQNLKNEATAQDLAVQFQGDLGKLEEGYYGLSGKAAADAYPKFSSDAQALQQKYLGVAPNPAVANMVGGTVKFSVGRSLMSGGRYAGEQAKAGMIDSADGHAQLLAYQAAKNWNDPDFQKTAFAGIDAAAENLGDLKNWSPETRQLYAQKYKDQAIKDGQENAKKFLQGKQPWKVISALGGGQASGGAQPTAANIDDIAATMRSKEGDVRGYKTPGGGAYQVHNGPVDENSTPAEQDAFFKTEFPKRMDQLASNLGRQVTPAEGALAWQQGVQGATNLINNPDANAASIVGPEAVRRNLPPGMTARAASMTAADFVNQVKGYYGLPDTAQATGQTTLTPSQMAQSNSPGEDAQIKAAFDALPPDEQQAMRKSVLDSWNSQNAAARADTNFQQEQQAKIEKKKLDDADSSVQQLMLAHAQDPTKPAVNILTVAQSPLYQGQPERVKGLIAFQKALDNPPDDKAADNATTQQLYRGILDGTVQPKDVQDAFAPSDGSPGKISRANLDFLNGVLKGDGDSADSKNTNALKAKFLSTAESGIKSTPVDGTDGDSAQYRFDFDFQKAWDDKVKAGEDPKGLITPGNKDYFGNLSTMALYSQTAADQLAKQKAAQDAIDHPGLLDRTLSAIGSVFSGGTAEAHLIPDDLPKGTTYGGKTKDGRDWYLRPDGSKVATGAPAAPAAPAQAPVAPAGPSVPSGE